jgi:hypothetical protein
MMTTISGTVQNHRKLNPPIRFCKLYLGVNREASKLAEEKFLLSIQK